MKTKKDRILKWLQSGRTITNIIAWNEFKSFKLSDIVFRLRNEGYNIATKMIKTESGSYANYKLKK